MITKIFGILDHNNNIFNSNNGESSDTSESDSANSDSDDDIDMKQTKIIKKNTSMILVSNKYNKLSNSSNNNHTNNRISRLIGIPLNGNNNANKLLEMQH